MTLPRSWCKLWKWNTVLRGNKATILTSMLKVAAMKMWRSKLKKKEAAKLRAVEQSERLKAGLIACPLQCLGSNNQIARFGGMSNLERHIRETKVHKARMAELLK